MNFELGTSCKLAPAGDLSLIIEHYFISLQKIYKYEHKCINKRTWNTYR